MFGKNTVKSRSSKGKTYSAFGETHTVKEWSEITGIPEDTIRNRLRKDWWSVEDALSIKPEDNKVVKTLTYNGETHTIKEWSEITGIPLHLIYSRLNANNWYTNESKWSVEEILTTPVIGKGEYRDNSNRKKTITYNGETHTIKEWSEITGLPVTTINGRLANKDKDFWTIERVLTTPLIVAKTYTYKGETHTLSEWIEIIKYHED